MKFKMYVSTNPYEMFDFGYCLSLLALRNANEISIRCIPLFRFMILLFTANGGSLSGGFDSFSKK